MLLAGSGCDVLRGPGSVEVWVFNKSMDTLWVAGNATGYWHSSTFWLGRSETVRLPLTRHEQLLDTLVVTTQVSSGDAGKYGAVVNVTEEPLGDLHIEEFSPYIGASLTRGHR